ncbi:carbamoyltransferase [Clostridium zeae]|uniref:Carbamoyltransferase n=1 Tax=Clostridium zeae TaxID=2759022 RepID=A0ABQ1EBZ7_9CLOT|nr:carbamoyltransferase HypF [Clostridium zeae]GFZ32261.1 carbamoyltransferase [Clostridium zeae]
MLRKRILVKGLVQGVGFRPFVYKIALENNLKGFVRNGSIGVIIDVEGTSDSIESFTEALRFKCPKLSNIEDISIEDKEIKEHKDFEIKECIRENNGFTFISPDLAICEDCYEDINDEQNARYRYPFTNCTNCGPRYSIISSIPYSRADTTMNNFKPCKSCGQEYVDQLNRRFNSEANCCCKCGPKVDLIDSEGNRINVNDPITEAIKLLKAGSILSIKGIGGFNLTCDARCETAIKLLRERKVRNTKPFGLMMKDLETVKKYCYISNKEEKILSGNKRPIVILKKRGDMLPDIIAPGIKDLGIMLPYTPLHHLLFHDGIEVLIMTSANLNGKPIIYKNEDAISKLHDIVDYHLINNRDIFLSVDDSVVKIINGNEQIIRRGRGYSPTYFKHNRLKDSMSLGSYLKNTFCVSKNGNIILSQYIGDLKNEETIERQYKIIRHLEEIYNIDPQIIAYDFHPITAELHSLERFEGKTIGTYHHHAHIASVLFENDINEPVIGVAYDGTGFGDDNTIWGGEFLIASQKNFKRVGNLRTEKMPGGDRAAVDPMRMGISYLCDAFKNNKMEVLSKINDIHNFNKTPIYNLNDIDIYFDMISKNINSPLTSSMGRLFDAVAYMLGFNRRVTFEGEAAIYLENMAHGNIRAYYEFGIEEKENQYVINTTYIIYSILKDLKRQIKKEVIAMKFHNTIIKFTEAMCMKIYNDYDINKVALSGGVFQNNILYERIYNNLISKGFRVYTNNKVPCNDGGISLGQIVIANEREAY